MREEKERDDMEERLQKLLSAAGVCSRRAAEDYLNAGRVTVNGETAGWASGRTWTGTTSGGRHAAEASG